MAGENKVVQGEDMHIHQSRTSSNEIVPVCIYISERERPISLSILVFPPF